MGNKIIKDDVKGLRIENIICIRLKKHEHIQRYVYSFLIVLDKGNKILRLNPYNLEEVNEPIDFDNKADIPVQIIDDGYFNEIINTVVYRILRSNENNDDHNNYQFGILLESGKIMVNAYTGDGGSVLHLEKFSEFRKHFHGDWKDYWTNTSFTK